METITTYKISYKGSIPHMVMDAWLKIECSDIMFGYGVIEFTGTEKQLDEFCKIANKDHMYMKILGVTP